MCRIRRIGLRGIFQLTSSQGGWHHKHLQFGIIFFSTHILTRRMTLTHRKSIQGLIFQLTSSQGGWRYFFSLLLWKQLFNSHPHKEDDWSSFSFNDGLIFSTHILTRRMTSPFVYMQLLEPFQLTSSQGGWLWFDDECIHSCSFQLTSSQGGWPLLSHIRTTGKFFNSHPHKEDDAEFQRSAFSIRFSTHILTRRMTGMAQLQMPFLYFFNSHPHKEDDRDPNNFFQPYLIFQLTSSQGGWRVFSCVGVGFIAFFNSHPHKEDDAWIHRAMIEYIFFNSHPHKEDDVVWVYCSTSNSWFFNSHPHKEDDEWRYNQRRLGKSFSTHILTRRMTDVGQVIGEAISFQLTSSQGGWHYYMGK